MNQQSLKAYLNLIQGLLSCPSGEEWILLRQNEKLVNTELVEVMEQVASHLAAEGQHAKIGSLGHRGAFIISKKSLHEWDKLRDWCQVAISLSKFFLQIAELVARRNDEAISQRFAIQNGNSTGA